MMDATTMTPMQEYDWATGPDGWLTADGWERLAGDLTALAERHPDLSPRWLYYTDRAADCRSRAARMRAGVVVR